MTGPTSIIYLEDVTVNFDGFKALSHLNFFMDRRELRVVIGPNGAGKTTLLDVVSGRVKPESGRVIFGHHTDLLHLRENEIAQLGVGRKFQTPSVFVNLSVWDNVELSLSRASKGVLAALFERDAEEARARIAQTLDTVALGAKANWKAEALSHGEKQWLEIGMVIAQDPELLLPGPGAPARGRAGGGHDRRGNRAHRGAARGDRRGPVGPRHRARHGVRAPDRPQSHRAPSGHGAL